MPLASIKAITLPLVLVAFVVTGCENTGASGVGPKTGLGAALGAAGGGLIGAAAGGGATGIAAGVLLGGLAGGVVGNKLDNEDKRMAARASQRALETQRTGTTTSWRNPDTGHSGTVTPTRTYQSASGQYCREYQQSVLIGGEKHQSYGTACRQPDGSWKIVN